MRVCILGTAAFPRNGEKPDSREAVFGVNAFARFKCDPLIVQEDVLRPATDQVHLDPLACHVPARLVVEGGDIERCVGLAVEARERIEIT